MKFLLLALISVLGLSGCAVSNTPAMPKMVTQFAVGSCAKERMPQPIWQTILDTNPELFLFIGDNVYADNFESVNELGEKSWWSEPVTDPARFVEAYSTLAAKPGFAALRNAVPILPMWDDHDYGANDAGKEYPLKKESQQAFLDFFGFAQDDPIRQQEGIYQSYITGEQGQRVQFIMLDTRYHRDALVKNPMGDGDWGRYVPNTDTSSSILGDTQWEWFEQELQKPADIRFVISSIQVVAYEHGWESWGNMAHERQRLYDLIAKTGAEGVVFITGDRHLTELSVDKGQGSATLPYPMWDFTASGMTDDFSEVNEPNQYNVGGPYRGSHFGTVTIDWADKKSDTTITFKALTDKGDEIYRGKVALSELQLAD